MSLNFVLSWIDLSLLCILLLLPLLLLIIKRTTTRTIYLPPSPPKLPFIGNLHQLSSPLHLSLHALSKKHGPLMLLQLGQVSTLVVSSPDSAREIMKTHDAIFASRPSIKAARILLYGSRDITFAPYGEYWRQVRRLSVNHLLGVKMMATFHRVREEEVALMITDISTAQGLVDMSEILNLFTNNLLCRAVFGKSFRGEANNRLFRELIEENIILLEKLFVEDFFPSLGWLDNLLGFERRARKNFERWDALLEEIVEEHENKLGDENYKPGTKDFVDVLLALQNDTSADFAVNREVIKILILDMIAAGTDTSFIALEWGMAELIHNPEVMKKLQDEVRGIANRDSMIREEHLSRMNYLKAVIKEVLRLHPPVPLLLPRESMEACQIQGYKISARTRVIVNGWAIARDQESWDEPEEFRPERFLGNNIDFRGKDFELIPFGTCRS